jgi:hypothetical protein
LRRRRSSRRRTAGYLASWYVDGNGNGNGMQYRNREEEESARALGGRGERADTAKQEEENWSSSRVLVTMAAVAVPVNEGKGRCSPYRQKGIEVTDGDKGGRWRGGRGAEQGMQEKSE